MSERIENTIYPNFNFSLCVEDLEVGHLTYRLTDVKRWYPHPAKITGYVAVLMFGQGKSDMIELQLPDIKSLDEIIEFLMELKMKWEVAEKALANADSKV